MRGKSKFQQATILVLTAALAAFVVGAPASAIAAPADNEYDLDLPGGDGTGDDPQANPSGTGTDVEQPTATEPVVEDTGEETQSGVVIGRGGDGGSGGPKGDDKSGASPSKESAESAGSLAGATPTRGANAGSDDGGPPIVLIAIALFGLACLVAAAWRMRASGGGVGPAEAGSRGI